MRSLLNPQARSCCNLWSSYQELNRPRIMAKRSDKYFKSRCLCRDLANDAERDQNGQLGPGKERLFNVAGRSARNQDLATLDWLPGASVSSGESQGELHQISTGRGLEVYAST